jgi:hypothetical protein
MYIEIDRQKWARKCDKEFIVGELLNSEGKMCCLGFVCLLVGFSKEDIKGKLYPSNIVNQYRKERKEIPLLIEDFIEPMSIDYFESSVLAAEASIINDTMSSDENKENTLKNYLANMVTLSIL